MYFPEYIAGFVFMIGPIIVNIIYLRKIKTIKKELGISFMQMYDHKYSESIKRSLKGTDRAAWFIIILFFILAIITALINKQ